MGNVSGWYDPVCYQFFSMQLAIKKRYSLSQMPTGNSQKNWHPIMRDGFQ